MTKHYVPVSENAVHIPLQEAHSPRSWQNRLARLVIATGLLTNPHVDGALGPNPAAEVRPMPQSEEEASYKEGQPFDIEAAYRASEAKLDTESDYLTSVPLTRREEEKLKDMETRLRNAGIPLGKGGGDQEAERNLYRSVLTGSETKLFMEKSSLLYDRSIIERDKALATIESNNARLLGVVRTRSGIRFNIFEAQTDGKRDHPKIDAKALDVSTDLLIHELGNIEQTRLPKYEVERLQKLAADGKLDTVTINMIIADNFGECVVSMEDEHSVRQLSPGEKCNMGLHIDSSDLQASTTDFRNSVVLIGRSSVPDANADTNTILHEEIHGLMAATGLTSYQRIIGSPEDEPWKSEHEEIVYPLLARVYEIASAQDAEQSLQVLKDIPFKPDIQENSWELHFSDGEIRGPKEIANNIVHDKGRGLKFACIQIIEQLNSGSKQLNVTRSFDYPIVEGYEGGSWEPLLNPQNHNIKLYSAVPGPDDKPVIEEIKFDPETMSVMPIYLGSKGEDMTTFSGELISNQDFQEYHLKHADKDPEFGLTPVATEHINLPA